MVRRAILSIARKNGKTALIAGLMLCHLVGPEAIPNGEIYSAANDREQAAVVYKMAAQIVRADPELNALLRCIDSTKTITCRGNGSFYRALSAESGTKHGLNPTFIVYDELSQAKNRNLLDVLQTSMGARAEPLMVVISTQSNDPQHVLSVMIDDALNAGDETTVCHLYEIPEDDDAFDEANWIKANPAIDDFRSREDMRTIAERAARTPSDEPMFRNLYCNQRVAPTSSVIARKEWAACASWARAQFLPRERIYLGLDMSSVNDLTALVAVSDGPLSKIMPFAWKPRMYLDDHSDRDFGNGVRRYREWFDRGHLLVTETRTIDPEAIARHIAMLCSQYEVLGLAYDLWRIKDVLNVFDRIGLEAWEDKGREEDRQTKTGLRVVSWGQGFRDMGPAVTALEREVQDRTLVHPENPVLTWAVGNSTSQMDAAGNKKLDKEASRFRIDPAVAMTMALGLKSRDRKPPPKEIQFF